MIGKSSRIAGIVALAASSLAFVMLLLLAGATGDAAPAQSHPQLEQRFDVTVRPFLKTYCIACHGKQAPQAQLDLTAFTSVKSVAQDSAHWTSVLQKLSAKQMPPASAGKQPSSSQRDAVIAWIRAERLDEATRNAGDPGEVLAHRLSNAEYDYTIRDLTGQDLHPTREFPVDPADQEGFDNSGESLTLSAALVKKYVKAAKDISDHLVLTSTGLEFASHPVLVETDRDKFCILRIVDFYKKQPTDLADYFHAAWEYRHRAELGMPAATLKTIAARSRVSPRYLDLVWSTLNAPKETVGPVANLQGKWNALPAPGKGLVDLSRPACQSLRDWVLMVRKRLAWHFSNLPVPSGFSNGGQCFVLWKDIQYATHRRMLYPDALQVGGVPQVQAAPPRRRRGGSQQARSVTISVDPDLYIPQDSAARAPYFESFNRFCSVFPDAFYISERGRMFVDEPTDQGRLLTAGLHNSMGYFRDDTPLMELILDDKEQKKLNQMWLDFDLVAYVPERMHKEFFVYERAEAGTINDPEFNFARPEDPNSTSDAMIKKLADLYLAKARRNGGQPLALQAIEDHFRWVSTTIRAAEKARLAAEPVHLHALLEFAAKAYRRPITAAESSDLLAFYRSLRQKEDLTHEEAVRDTVVSILMSPKFLFRMDLDADAESPFNPSEGSSPQQSGPTNSPRRHAESSPPQRTGVSGSALQRHPKTSAGANHVHVAEIVRANRRAASRTVHDIETEHGTLRTITLTTGVTRSVRTDTNRATNARARVQSGPAGQQIDSVQALPDYALASRLSYFLWSSIPDAELLAHAAAGDLHKPEVLTAQAHRMLRDPRVRALALEFGGNWLDFRRFEEQNAVDRERFPSFTDDLREAMFQEPVRFLMDDFQNDRSVLNLLYGKYTFVNANLAQHYGMADVKPEGTEWVRVDNADRDGRGGLLPMAVFLTQNSPGLRTSPVKRGYWVVRRLLGEVISPPPPTVPQLPSDESKLGSLTLRQALEEHRSNPACAGCHARFDSYGLVFEGYGPIGELRTKDLGGKLIDARAPFPGGECSGVAGLKEFVRTHRQQDFLDTLARKLLSYALERSIQPSDTRTLQEMQHRLAAGGYRFDTLVDTIITSRQFRYRRAKVTAALSANR